jgi:hypothetical protein
VAKILSQQPYRVNAVKDAYHGNMQEAQDLHIHKAHKQYRILEVNNVPMIHTINKILLMYTSTDLMKELVYLPDKVFILIVKSLHLIIKMLNHVGHEPVTR